MRKFFLFLFCTLFLVQAGFSRGQSEGSQGVIGISKIVAHPALDAIEQGIIDELTEQGYVFDYDLQNANGDVNAAASIAQKFKSDGVRLAVGIATPTAQALVQALDEIPVIYSGVTDPVVAGIVESYDRGGSNVTGVSDLTLVRPQIEFLVSLMPNLKNLGHVYTSSEDNSVILADTTRKAAAELGLNFIEATVTNSSEVRSAVQSIASRVDAIYISTDNTVVSALPAVIEVAQRSGIAIMSADPSSAAEGGVLAAWGFNYYKMGRSTGSIIIEVLNGRNTEEIPTQYMESAEDIDLLVDLGVANALGISIPQDVVDSASTVIQ